MNAPATAEVPLRFVSTDETHAQIEAACRMHFALGPDEFVRRWQAGTLDGDQRMASRLAMFLG